MITCTSCGFEAPDDFAFCPKCATALTAPLAVPEERKVVTTLFCDLVAFTAMSEAADPEDVDRLLNEYSSRARRVIESHGGTVEKFIGDAVVGVFGVPVAHEDDPERAVRAGSASSRDARAAGLVRPDGTPLQARCGVNTGEALVRLDVDPPLGPRLPHRRRGQYGCPPPGRRPADGRRGRRAHSRAHGRRHRLRGAAADICQRQVRAAERMARPTSCLANGAADDGAHRRPRSSSARTSCWRSRTP